ncbi:MAG TPA: hypothetical protein VNW26_12270 [Steroidobacteraceae bacterium]|nr:hypothetical protein [Steroidobacteraceae bacterium]
MQSRHYFRFTQCRAASRKRSKLLEGLLARADAVTTVTDWRADAFAVIAEPAAAMPGVAAAALYSERGPVDGASVFIATPVHYAAEMSNVRLAADGILSLRGSDAETLAVDFNRTWNDAGIRMLAGRCAELFCVFDQPLDATTREPEDVLDRHIEGYLPAGAGAPRLRRLMSEIEMWLFEHDVNRTRIAAGATAVNGLWLWGGGAALTSLPLVRGWTAGDDPLFKAFAGLTESSRGAGAQIDAHNSTGSAVIVVAAEPGTAAWCDTESRRLERSVADLRSGRIARLELSALDRCFSVTKRWLWRRWRARRPWWESFA